MKHTLKLITLSILGLITLTTGSYAQETVVGKLEFLEADNKETFLAIDSTKKLTTKSDDGSLVSSKIIQIAGLTPSQWQEAMKLVGKVVTCTGRPMAAMTVHHHTPVLLISQSLSEASADALDNATSPKKTSPVLDEQQPSDNAETSHSSHSKEWEN